MKVLIGCEFSGVVREAFRRRGHDAWSCDLLPAADNSPYHIQNDVLTIGNHSGWDLAIFHPPCTHLAASGARWWKDKKQEQAAAIGFIVGLRTMNIPRVAIENPIGILSRVWRKPDQIVQPWWFGDPHEKSTCLWLKDLPLLKPTNKVDPLPRVQFSSGRTMPAWYNLPQSKHRSKLRSITFKGFAEAMAEQWG
jgi:hypothetical protein